MEEGRKLAGLHPDGGIFCLYGDLGSGKTVFTKGFAAGLGIDEKKVKSPTYTLLRTYNLKKGTLYHFDFYRSESVDDLLEGEIREILGGKRIWVIIEWPKNIESILPDDRINLEFTHLGGDKRRIEIK